MGQELDAHFGYLSGGGTESPVVGLAFTSPESTTVEFKCGAVELRVRYTFFGVAAGNFNDLNRYSTLTFKQSKGVQEFSRFESGWQDGIPQQMQVKTSASGEFEPNPGASVGYEARFKVKTSVPLEIKET